MGTFRFSDRRFLNTVAAVSLLIGVLAPGALTAFASAQTITTRSIEMSSSAENATGVDYAVTFTPVQNAGGFLIDFCDNTPLVGEACTAPAGFSTASVATSGGPTVETLTSDSGAIVTDTLTAGDPATVTLTGIANPSYLTTDTADQGFYARITTYAAGSISGVTATDSNTTPPAGSEDQGGVALSTTSSFSVSGAVLETMTFCVSGANTDVSGDDNCNGGSGDITSPNLNIGTDNDGTYVLSNDYTAPSTGTVYTQLSTNAVDGAVVNLKSSASGCGGLINVEDSSDCIGPAPTGGVVNGGEGFGAETGLSAAVATTGDTSATGSIVPATGYSDSSLFMSFTAGGSPVSGVTSEYGSPILTSDGAPVNDMNMPLTFGAVANNVTPAGEYSATLNLVADGTF
jgi:hypothetical protein